MNKSLVATLILLGVASVYLYSLDAPANNAPYSFEQFKADYGKRYTKEGQEQYRKNIFLRNLIKIQQHNANPTNTYTVGVNQFTDLTQAEFAATYLTLQVPKKSLKKVKEADVTVTHIVGDVDWVAAGGVTPVKNQGQCGSCWAFSATGSLESAHKIGASVDISLSEQQLVDCSKSFGNQGCNGGWMDSAFDYAVAKGITTTKNYAYVGRDQNCTTDGGPFKISGYTDVTGGCNGLQNALSGQTVSVAVDASNWSPYSSGIFSNCGKNINHGVLVVGFTTDRFWLVKNSWGTSWGEKGYIRLLVGDTCAICQYASYPNL